MQLLSFISLVVAITSVSAAQSDVPPHAGSNLKYDESADWYREHGKPSPDFAPEVTVVEDHKSYIVKLECPGCPLYVREGKKAPRQERNSSVLLKFDLQDASSGISTVRVNGAQILPLDPMPLFVNAFQVADNLTQDTMGSIVSERMLDSDFASQTRYSQFPLQYEHTLLKTKKAGQWWLQFDVTGVQYGGEEAKTLHFKDKDDKIVQILVKEVKVVQNASKHLQIADLQVVPRSQRAQPIKMKCGKPALVQTSFDPSEWDQYGKLGTWSRVWNMLFGRIGKYGSAHLQHNALLLPLALLFAIVVFFARVWHQQRQQDKSMDAEYALLESECDEAAPIYLNIPIIKIEEYD